MSWTKNIPAAKRLDCITVANDVFTQAERKLSHVERTGLDRERIRVAAFMPRLPETPLDRGSRRYASYMGKKFRQHGLDFRVEEAQSADALELLLMGAQVNDKIYGTFVFFPRRSARARIIFCAVSGPKRTSKASRSKTPAAWRSTSAPWTRKKNTRAWCLAPRAPS
jgi:hypothetical protein